MRYGLNKVFMMVFFGGRETVFTCEYLCMCHQIYIYK